MEKNNVLKFWIIHHPSGLCLFQQTFEELPNDADPEIVAGFLYAMTSLTTEIARQNINHIQLDTLRFNYSLDKHYIMVAVCHNSYHIEEAAELLAQLRRKFNSKYANYFHGQFSFDISIFKNFAQVVEDTVQQETLYVQYFKKRNEQISEFIEESSKDWQKIRGTLTDRAKMLGKWVASEKIALNKQVADQIIRNRQITQKKEEEENGNSSDGWV
ncbi:hypothetical protein ES708_35083 [subsurface metagenome]